MRYIENTRRELLVHVKKNFFSSYIFTVYIQSIVYRYVFFFSLFLDCLAVGVVLYGGKKESWRFGHSLFQWIDRLPLYLKYSVYVALATNLQRFSSLHPSPFLIHRRKRPCVRDPLQFFFFLHLFALFPYETFLPFPSTYSFVCRAEVQDVEKRMVTGTHTYC